jgi:hypothetical protein
VISILRNRRKPVVHDHIILAGGRVFSKQNKCNNNHNNDNKNNKNNKEEHEEELIRTIPRTRK